MARGHVDADFSVLPGVDTADLPPGLDRRAFIVPTNRRVDFDTTVDAMALTAREMNSKSKETSEGGLAVSVTLC